MPNYKNPPSLETDKDYSKWKMEVNLWENVTDLAEDKRALALALTLEGKPREVALGVDADKLKANDGVKVLIAELDKMYEKNKVDRAYCAYTEFDKCRRNGYMSMSEYMIEFEQKYNACKIHEMVLPDAILAFKLLDNASLSQTDRQLALTACSDLKFETMKGALSRIFGTRSPDSASGVSGDGETVFMTQRYERGRYRGNRGSRRPNSGYRGNRSNNSGRQGLNPSFNGIVSRCGICESKFHWAKNCPDKNYDVNISKQIRIRAEKQSM